MFTSILPGASFVRWRVVISVCRTMSSPVVTIKQGKLRGKLSKNYNGETYYSFKGIPYAKPPVGPLRFKAPEPAEPWTGEYNATTDGPECPSKHMLLSYYVGKEARCLNLNVFTRKLPSAEQGLKPVMFWIHGGGFILGSNKTDIYEPSYLMMEDIVLVTINYRLGVLGFLSIEDESFDIPGNAGLKDQVMALKWVQENIKNFNGDPNNVTLFGESAGAASVHYLMLSQLTKGLFHKAIMQSGTALNCWAEGTKGTKEICKMLGYKETHQAKALEYLRKVSARKLVMANYKSRDAVLAGEKRFYAPVIEKPHPQAFITDTPENIIQSGNYNKVPLIMGYNSREGILFEVARRTLPNIELPKNLLSEIDYRYKLPDNHEKRKELAERIRKYYYGDEDITEKNIEKTMLLKTDTVFLYKIHEAINMHQNNSAEPVFVYRMELDTSLNIFKKMATAYWLKSFFVTNLLAVQLEKGFFKEQMSRLSLKLISRDMEGTSHADDLAYLFKTFVTGTIQPGSIEELSVKRFVKLWTNFAKYGNPTPSDVKDDCVDVKWEPVNGEKNYLNLSKKLSMTENPDLERIKFWDSIFNECIKNQEIN